MITKSPAIEYKKKWQGIKVTSLERKKANLQKNIAPQSIQDISPVSITTSFLGPIPPPNFLELYEKLVPGTAKKFLEEPHLEAEHRRALEKEMVQEQINMSKRGQGMAFFLATFCVIAAFGAIFLGYDIGGLGALIVSITAFSGIFFYAKKQN
jgi:uncharacterized membrane protein